MKDLTNLPKQFHVLFTTDWNNGNESEMNSIQRGRLSLLFLEYNKWDVQRMIDLKKPIEPESNIGFVND
jgi:hypothetical protein